MINKTIADALSEQMNKELYSAYLYLDMSAYLNEIGYHGMSSWAKVQAKEEVEHAEKFFDYLCSHGAQVPFGEIAAPKYTKGEPVAIFEQIYSHELFVTRLIKELSKLVDGENDKETRKLVDWFLKEQVEEEGNTLNVFNKVKACEQTHEALAALDAKLGQRTV